MSTDLRDIPTCYVDFGPATQRRRGHMEIITQQWRNRPHCTLCGPFRGRFLRKAGEDEFGTLWHCYRCDYED